MLRYIFFILIFNSYFSALGKDLHLLIKMPTRSRPAQFFKTLDLYYAKLSGNVKYTFLITCDIEDSSMNTPEIKKKLEQYPHLRATFNNNKSKVEAYNRDVDLIPDWDIILVTSDDMIPVAYNYDQIICETMQKYFRDLDGVLNFYDGHAKTRINTMPVIGKKFYAKFGYIYHPAYKSLYCDEELTLVSRMLAKEALLHTTIIEHHHPHHGKAAWDELYRINESLDTRDKAVFEKRRAHNFHIKRR